MKDEELRRIKKRMRDEGCGMVTTDGSLAFVNQLIAFIFLFGKHEGGIADVSALEIADADDLNDNPIHPYTLSLLSAVPIPDPNTARNSKRIILEGDVPSPLKMPSGCPFRTRCRFATEQCAREMPKLTDRGNGHFVACHEK